MVDADEFADTCWDEVENEVEERESIDDSDENMEEEAQVFYLVKASNLIKWHVTVLQMQIYVSTST